MKCFNFETTLVTFVPLKTHASSVLFNGCAMQEEGLVASVIVHVLPPAHASLL